MKVKEIIIIAIKNIFRSKTKFALTFVSICIGISSVIIITTIGNIGSDLINEKLQSMGIDGIFITDNSVDGVINQDLIERIEYTFDVDQVMPVVSAFGAFNNTRIDGQAVVWGVDQSLYDTLQINSIAGSCFSESDVKNANYVAIIDENLANELYLRDNVVGKTITIGINNFFADFEIIGVISDQKALIDSFMGENSFNFIYIPYTVVQQINQNEKITQLAIRSSGDLDELLNDLEYFISKNQELDGMLEVQNISAYIEIITDITKYLTIILSFVASISMVVAGIGVLNMMLSSTIERKKEIGIYMALGATNIKVGLIFLSESIIICLFSGVFGAIIGMLTVFIGASFLELPFSINYEYIIIVEIISFVSGIFAGIIPAIKASKLNPIDVLRE